MEVIVIMKDDVFNLIDSSLKEQFKHVEFKEENEYESNKSDKVYLVLYKELKKAKKKKDEYLFNKRHNATT